MYIVYNGDAGNCFWDQPIFRDILTIETVQAVGSAVGDGNLEVRHMIDSFSQPEVDYILLVP